MALRVWLPLNGNLENKGLTANTITSSGSTVDASGKIGSCMKLIAGTNTGIVPNLNTTSLSMGGWFKFNKAEIAEKLATLDITSSRTTPTGNLIGNHSYGGMGIIWFANNMYSTSGVFNNIYCMAHVRSDTLYNQTASLTLEFDVWTHLFLTFDVVTRKFSFYKNGTLYRSIDLAAASDIPTTRGLCIDQGWVYGGNGPGTSIPIRANDIRIYDHCLSPREVKEISRGLVLHYKLDDPYIGFQFLKYVRSSGTQYINTGILMDETVKVECQYQATQNGGLLWGTANAGTTGLTAWAASSGYNWRFGGKAADPIPSYNPAALNHVIQDKTGLWINSETRTNTYSSAASSFDSYPICIFGSPNDTSPESSMDLYYFKLWKGGELIRYFIPCKRKSDSVVGLYDLIENTFYPNDGTGTFTAGSVLQENNIVYDCSGYRNNGTPNGTLTLSDDSPRYGIATKYPDSSCSIGIGNLSTYVPDGNFTFNCWFKKVTGEWSSKGYETIFGGPSGFELEAKNASTNAPSLVPWNWGKNAITYELDKWNMVTFTRNASETKLYLNGGETITTGTAGSIPSGNYFIGAWNSATQQNYRGHFSDARLYATCLSADDIKELYNTSALIHNDGTIEAFEFVETNSGSPEVTKTGLYKAQNIVEYPVLCEWLQSDGNAVIDTGVPYDSTKDTYKIECKFCQPSNKGSWDGAFGAYKGESYKTLRCIRLNGNSNMGFYYNDKAGGGNPITPGGSNTNIKEVVFTSSSLVVTQSGTTTTKTYGTKVSATDVNDINFFLFSATANGSSYTKMYYFRIYDGDTLLRDMVPCISNGVPGMWDKVEHKFYKNCAASGTFTTGDVIDAGNIAKLYATKIEANQIIET